MNPFEHARVLLQRSLRKKWTKIAICHELQSIWAEITQSKIADLVTFMHDDVKAPRDDKGVSTQY